MSARGQLGRVTLYARKIHEQLAEVAGAPPLTASRELELDCELSEVADRLEALLSTLEDFG